MGYRSRASSRRGSGNRPSRSTHSKPKSKTKKTKGGQYVEETPVPSLQEISENTVSSLDRLGGQTFAVSPFSNYFDDWLMSLRQVISEFESNAAVNVDEALVNERKQIFADVEGELATLRLREADLEASAKALSESNHLLVELDAQYAAQTRELSQKRNSDIENLTKNVQALKEELAEVNQMKTSFFGFTKKAKKQKQEEVTGRLNVAKNKVEVVVQNFAVEQEKLHDDYQKKKQETMAKVRSLEKEIEDIETDRSVEPRKATSTALSNAVNTFIQRTTISSS
ncbi:MAG: hypothetical protein NWF00_05595 [Candidatus Bathyarchaeota archaeon]|nr:hypothetical protein [Candidatus Bathyarchaeota archaeon]